MNPVGDEVIEIYIDKKTEEGIITPNYHLPASAAMLAFCIVKSDYRTQ